MRLIDAEVMLQEIKKADEADPDLATCWSRGSIRRVIEGLPTIEAAPVVFGEWEEYSGCGNSDRRCSNCKDYYTDEPKNLRFCPICGAKMEEYTGLVPAEIAIADNERRFSWRYPDSEAGRKWHPAVKQLPDHSGSYYVILKSGDPHREIRAIGTFDHGKKTWTLSPECRGCVVEFWKEDE